MSREGFAAVEHSAESGFSFWIGISEVHDRLAIHGLEGDLLFAM